MNFVLFKKSLRTKFMYKNELFSKFKDEKRTFQNLWIKTKFHVKFRNENNNLIYI